MIEVLIAVVFLFVAARIGLEWLALSPDEPDDDMFDSFRATGDIEMLCARIDALMTAAGYITLPLGGKVPADGFGSHTFSQPESSGP